MLLESSFRRGAETSTRGACAPLLTPYPGKGLCFGDETVDRAIPACRRRRGYSVPRFESLAVAQLTRRGGHPLQPDSRSS
jgi:hypothetical protein